MDSSSSMVTSEAGPRTDEQCSSASESDEKPSARERVRRLTLKSKAKAKKLLHIDPDGRTEVEQHEALGDIQEDPAFNPSKAQKRLDHGHASNDKEATGAASKLRAAATAVAHPQRLAKSKAKRTTAEELAPDGNPTREDKQEYLEALDDLDRAETSRPSNRAPLAEDEDGNPSTERYRDNVRRLEERRDKERVSWITTHLNRVRVVPEGHIDYLEADAFIERDEYGRYIRHRWEKWLGHTILYFTQGFTAQYVDDFEKLPFDMDVLGSHVERLVLASAPWQVWVMDVRRVYRWEDPMRTGRWLVLYALLCYTEHVMGFVWASVVYFAVKSRYYPSSAEDIKASLQRTAGVENRAYELGELIQKHGRQDWLDSVIQELGPQAQLQLGDMANMLEVVSNFYHWRSPRKTLKSVFLFSLCLLISVVTDWAWCMRLVWIALGGLFFLCWPVASLYPKYRYIVSPVKWLFWGIPTHAEWAFEYLQKRSQLWREAIIAEKTGDPANATHAGAPDPRHPEAAVIGQGYSAPTASDDSDDRHSADSCSGVPSATDIMSFPAEWQGARGRLVIHSAGVRFVQSHHGPVMWQLPFIEMEEMRKIEAPKVARSTLRKLASENAMSTGDELELKRTNGHVWRLHSVRDRDEAFNCIIGFSGLQWQSLQSPCSETGEQK